MSVSFENQSSVPSEDRREERQPRAAGPGVRVGHGAEPGAGRSLEPPSPVQLPSGGSVSLSRSAPDSGLKCSRFFCLVRAPCRLHAGLCCPRRWGGSTHPPEEGTSLEKVPSGGGLRAGQGVCAPRTDLGAIALLFVTGVTPSGCPWGPSRHHPSAGEPRGCQGRGREREVTVLRVHLRGPPRCRLTPPRAPRMPALPTSCPWPLRANRVENPASALHACKGQGLADLESLRKGAQQPRGPGLEGALLS